MLPCVHRHMGGEGGAVTYSALRHARVAKLGAGEANGGEGEESNLHGDGNVRVGRDERGDGFVFGRKGVTRDR